QRSAGGRVPAGARMPRNAAGRAHRGADGASRRPPDDRGLPDRGHGRGRLPRGAVGPPRRADRQAGGRYSRAVGLRPRHPELGSRTADELGALDADAVARVCEEAWPQPESAEEVHEALLWIGYVTAAEAAPWKAWVDELRAGGRIVAEGDRLFAAEAGRDPKTILCGRMEALGPVFVTDPDETALMLHLESEGVVLRARIDGRQTWCGRRLLAASI